MDKVPTPKKQRMEISVNTPPELLVPKHCNLVSLLYSKERGEVILDFVYFDERIKRESSVIGHQVAKVAMSPSIAQNLLEILGNFFKEEK